MKKESPLGRNIPGSEKYDPEILFAMPRRDARDRVMKDAFDPPFHGVDLWNAYEISWLDSRGKPQVAVGEFRVPADSGNLIESKSLKLYLNSLNQTPWESIDEVSQQIAADLSQAADSVVGVRLGGPGEWHPVQELPGKCVDDLPVSIAEYQPNPGLLQSNPGESVQETLHSHLLKTNCPVTGQPDWAAVSVTYSGPPISHSSFLKYLISYRTHSGYHENCIEQIFMDLLEACAPEKLTVQGFYTRRGGLDINPFRSNFESEPGFSRAWRQ